MADPLDDTLTEVLGNLSRRRLHELYRVIDSGELGRGNKVEALRTTVVQRLNGPRYQHVRRLWTNRFEAFLTGDPALLHGAQRPPNLLHRRDTGGLWTATSAMLIAGKVASCQDELDELVTRHPVDEVMAGETARGWGDTLLRDTVSALNNLMRQVQRRNAFLQLANEHRRRELKEAGITHRLPDLGVEDLRQFLLVLRAASVLQPRLARIEQNAQAVAEARERNEEPAETAPRPAAGHALQPVPETLERQTKAAVRECARADLPDQAAAIVPLTALYRWHWAEATGQAAYYLRSNGLATLRRAIARYLASHAHAQTQAITLLLPEGVQEIAPSEELRTAVDRQAHRLLEAATTYRGFASALPRGLRQEIRSELHGRITTLAKRYAPRLEALIEADIDHPTGPEDHETRVWLFGAITSLIVALMVEGPSTRRLRPWRRYMNKRLHFALNRCLESERNSAARVHQAGRIYAYAQAGGVDTTGWFRLNKPGLLDTLRLGLIYTGPEQPEERAFLSAGVDHVLAELERTDHRSAKGKELIEVVERARDAGLASAAPLTGPERQNVGP